MSIIRRRPLQVKLAPLWTLDFVDHPDGLLIALNWRGPVKLRITAGPIRRNWAMAVARFAAGVDVQMPPADDLSDGVPSENDISEETTDVERVPGPPTKVSG